MGWFDNPNDPTDLMITDGLIEEITDLGYSIQVLKHDKDNYRIILRASAEGVVKPMLAISPYLQGSLKQMLKTIKERQPTIP